MTKQCPITGRKAQSGCHVPVNRSQTGVRAKRRFLPNLQPVSFYSEIFGASIQLRLSARGLRTIEKNGGLDNYLLTKSPSRLTDEAKALKVRILKAQKAKAA